MRKLRAKRRHSLVPNSVAATVAEPRENRHNYGGQYSPATDAVSRQSKKARSVTGVPATTIKGKQRRFSPRRSSLELARRQVVPCSSYFGHQSAASIMDMESPELPVGISGIHANSSRRDISRNEKSPHDHIWELVGYLPRRKAIADHLVKRYLDELNPVHDCVQEEDFRATYDAFWDRKWGDDDLTAVDLRWLALLFMVLAFSELVDCPMGASPDAQERCEERSVQYFWASRKAIVLAPTFSGESPDLVSAGILVSQYLVYFGRKTESWLTSSFAIRMAQAQGMHIDGEIWRLPARALETRRRLWCKLYALDRSVALAVGRPYTIHSKHCMEMDVKNVCFDDGTEDADSVAQELPLSLPTRNVYYLYQQRLSTILGDIHDECFGISSLSGSYNTYEKVLGLDEVLLDWAESLPAYFRLNNPDQSLDAGRPYLYWQRIYLHSGYHFARVTLHRKYVLLVSITDRFQHSRDACISSACADLKLKLSFRHLSMAERLTAGGAMHNLFNSALVLAVIAVREPLLPRTAAIVEDLSAYCEKQRTDPWVNAFALAEVKVIELCIASAGRARQEGRSERPTIVAMGVAWRPTPRTRRYNPSALACRSNWLPWAVDWAPQDLHLISQLGPPMVVLTIGLDSRVASGAYRLRPLGGLRREH